jgi:hypothetical protein
MSTLTADRCEELAAMLPFCDLATLGEAMRALRNLATGIRYVAPGEWDGDIGAIADEIRAILTGAQP